MNSLRARMTVALVGVITLLASTSAILFYVVVERSVRGALDASLEEEARTYAAMMEFDAKDGFEFELEDALPVLTESEGARVHLGIWRDAEAIVASDSLRGFREHANPATLERPALFDLSLSDGSSARAIAFTFTARVDPDAGARVSPPGPLQLVLARDTEGMESMLRTLYLWFWTLGLLGIAGSSIVIGGVVRRGLRPLRDVATQVEAIDDRHLSRRVPVEGLPREVLPLVNRVNALLDGLERAFDRERQFTADAAHELRTPLSVLRTTAELALSRERTPAEYREALQESLETTLTTQRLVENLLLLARAETGPGSVPLELDEVPLRALVETSWAAYAESARARGLTFRNEIADDARVSADREKLRIVLSNLLSNAASYTEEGGWIAARSEPSAGLLLAVGDSGPPLTRAQRERMFDRLWRADAARSSEGMHCGIGLSVARALCQAMGYSIRAQVEGHALWFRITENARDPSGSYTPGAPNSPAPKRLI